MSFLPTSPRRLAIACTAVAATGVFAFAAQQSPRQADITPASRDMRQSPAVGTPSPKGQVRLATAPRTVLAAALDPGAAGADPYMVEPRVPRAAGTPCVETLAQDIAFFDTNHEFQFTWTPSGACTGPHSKIILAVDLTGSRDISAAVMRIHFSTEETGSTSPGPEPGGGVLFMGSPQETDLVGNWRFERDVTEYADAFRRGMQIGYATSTRDNFYNDFDAISVRVVSVRLLYYPATSATPAQRTADAMRSLNSDDFGPVAAWTFDTLPRNIERAYLDVMARATEPRAWYSCVPTAAMTMFPQLDSRFGMGDYRPFIAGLPLGCSADTGSYREIEVFIDGRRAGLAPLFPWMPSVIGQSNVDFPAPSVQALNMMPFRVDLTPFAARLNDGQPHTIIARDASGGEAVITGQLLLYLDKGRSVVTGAVTLNTLNSQPSVPTLMHTLTQSGDTVEGDITTFLRREYRIEGYVDTSHGRVRTNLYQVSRFANTQHLKVVGPDPTTLPSGTPYTQDYLQTVRLSNTVDRVTRRLAGTRLLAEDRDYTTWPISIDFHNGGMVEWFEGLPAPFSDHIELLAHQARGQRGTHYRLGANSAYASRLVDQFDASHKWRAATPTTQGGDYDWWSTRRYLFTDNRGSCYSAGLTTANGELQTRTRGTECANGNGIRWYAHPDGAPEATLWMPNP
jgi:hypothetical protein